MALSQQARDARRDSTLTRIGKALLAMIRRDAHKQKRDIRDVMEEVLRTKWKEAK